jgi:hypothetical protein
MIRNLPDHWDFEADLVAIGSGIGGLGARSPRTITAPARSCSSAPTSSAG